MPGSGQRAESGGKEHSEQRAQQPRARASERPKSPSARDGAAQPLSTQVTIPFMFGPMSPFIASSQLPAIFLQQYPNEDMNKQLLHLVSLSPQLRQHRPSVLRRGSQLLPQAHSSDSVSSCKVEITDGVKVAPSKADSSPQQTSPSQAKSSSPNHKENSIVSISNDRPARAMPETSTALFANGLCRWPGCEDVFEDYTQFLKHLYRDHGHGDRSIAQWRVQRDMVQHMETQLTVEKQRLLAMQLHLRMSEHRAADSLHHEASRGQQSLAVSLPDSWVMDSGSYSATKSMAELVRQGYCHVPASHFVPELVPSIDCYKYTNIRPPYTYASLIRWAILDSPEKQLSLNEIYHWFTKTFFYFRHNTATWKNAVRHNLSLHKCFVRVEGGKGAVWTVDETEFQRRKGQKFNRDNGMKWLAPYSLFSSQES